MSLDDLQPPDNVLGQGGSRRELPAIRPRSVLWQGVRIVGLIVAGCVAFVVVGAGMLTGIYSAARLGMTSSEPYQQGLAAAQADPDVVAALGEPIEAGWLVMPFHKDSGTSADIDLTTSIHGPDGRGILNIGARRQNGVWEYYTLSVEINDTGEVIVLND